MVLIKISFIEVLNGWSFFIILQRIQHVLFLLLAVMDMLGPHKVLHIFCGNLKAERLYLNHISLQLFLVLERNLIAKNGEKRCKLWCKCSKDEAEFSAPMQYFVLNREAI